jgi:TolB-like protein/DNA-binding winged helix-turn-helix (wHTH) protein/Flp pilus assembly protein TadD
MARLNARATCGSPGGGLAAVDVHLPGVVDSLPASTDSRAETAASLRLVGRMPDESPSHSSRLRFAPFEFDPATGELWKDGVPVRIQQQPARVLALLATHPGELLTREQIRRHVWSEGTFVDFDRGLNFAIMQIRTALGDEADSPHYIETLARRGYRFVAPVVAGETAPGAAPVHDLAGSSRPPRWHRLLERRPLVAGAAALAALATMFWMLWWPAPPAPASGRKMIVVVPFKNLGPPEDQFFADGVTDEVTSRLASIRGLGVISPTSARKYAAGGTSIREIGNELGVEYVLEGSVRWERTGSETRRVRVTPRLVRVSDEMQIWSQVLERELGEVFQLQSGLALEVASELNVRLRDSERGALEQAPTAHPDAYEAYLRGKSAAGRYLAPDLRIAIDLYERAVELDPGFALAWTELSYCHSLLYHHAPPDADEHLAPAVAAAEQALALEPGLGRAHMALGYYHYWGRRDYARALEEFAIAERSLPGESRLLELLGVVRRRQGRFEEALAKQEEVRVLNPRDAQAAWDIGSTYAMLRRHDDAARSWERAIAMAPDFLPGYRSWAFQQLRLGDVAGARRILSRGPGTPPALIWATLEYYAGDYPAALRWLSAEQQDASAQPPPRPRQLLLAWVHEAMGDQQQARAAYEAARAKLEAALERRPGDEVAHADLGLTLAGLGLEDAALAEGRKAVELVPLSVDAVDAPFLLLDLARIQSRVGDHEAALDGIEQLLSIPSGFCVSRPYLKMDPAFRPLRDHPRFRRIVEFSR